MVSGLNLIALVCFFSYPSRAAVISALGAVTTVGFAPEMADFTADATRRVRPDLQVIAADWTP